MYLKCGECGHVRSRLKKTKQNFLKSVDGTIIHVLQYEWKCKKCGAINTITSIKEPPQYHV
jgi:hypothetical protein